MATQKRTAILLAFYQLVSKIRYDDADEWEKVKLDDKVRDYFPQGGAAFAGAVNLAPFFKRDKIVMEPDDFRNKKVLGDLYDEIVTKYLEGNWRLFP